VWLVIIYFHSGIFHPVITVVSRIYAPRFGTLALVESVGGGLICGI